MNPLSLTRPGLARIALIAACVAAALAGCGKLGELERPGPLSPTAKAARDPSHTVTTVDPRDRTADPAAPLPQGALPDVYSSPR